MLKRFWPLLTIVMVVVLSAIILPATTGLIPKLSDLKYKTKTYPTSISLITPFKNFPDGVKEGEPFELSGHLYYVDMEYLRQNEDLLRKGVIDEYDAYLPLPYRSIRLYIIGANYQRELLTDSEGYFHTTVQTNTKWLGWIFAKFDGDEKIYAYPHTQELPLKIVYLPSRESIPEGIDENSITSSEQGGLTVLSSAISIVSIAFATPFIVISGYFIYRYRKKLLAWLRKRKASSLGRQTENMYLIQPTPEAAWEVSTGDPRVKILFPQIENPLPPVWGIGEPLTILSRVLINSTENNANAIPAIKTTNSAIDIVAPDFSPLQFEHTFDKKGETDVNVHFGGDNGEKMFGTHQIKIVDYREEIVELFNRLIDSLLLKGVAVDRKMTAREIESQLITKYPDISPDTIKEVVKGFEYANYSLHPVARKIYVDMYLAVGKIRERVKNA